MKRAAARRGRRSFVVRGMIACMLALAGPLRAQLHHDPDSVRIVTTDVARFWNIVDHAGVNELAAAFSDEYLASGSDGLRAFAPEHIGSGFSIARDVYTQRARYDSIRASSLRAGDAEPAIRAAMRKLKSLYDDAVFPDVYFVVGRFITGGYNTRRQIVVATELYPDPMRFPYIVAHELLHQQQPPPSADESLLERAFHEGSADFLGELISGGTINPDAQRFGRAHERELWKQFQAAMHAKAYSPWLYERPSNGWPNDLGYFFGYRIAQAYYNRAADKRAAIRTLISTTKIDALLAASGYSP